MAKPLLVVMRQKLRQGARGLREWGGDPRNRPLIVGLSAVALLVGLLAWRWVVWLNLDALHWDLVLSSFALFFNVVLCSSQIIVWLNLGEYSQDHMNKFDVESSIKHLAIPEQLLQLAVLSVHLANRAWLHVALQLPITLWHAYNHAYNVSQVKAVLGESERFEQTLAHSRRINLLKVAYYIGTMVMIILRICPIAVLALMQTRIFAAFTRSFSSAGSRNTHAGGGSQLSWLVRYFNSGVQGYKRDLEAGRRRQGEFLRELRVKK